MKYVAAFDCQLDSEVISLTSLPGTGNTGVEGCHMLREIDGRCRRPATRCGSSTQEIGMSRSVVLECGLMVINEFNYSINTVEEQQCGNEGKPDAKQPRSMRYIGIVMDSALHYRFINLYFK